MKYEIRYDQIDQQTKRDAAISDMRTYLSAKSFGIIGHVAMIADEYRQLSFTASFAGVQGYPVVALWDETREEMRYMTS